MTEKTGKYIKSPHGKYDQTRQLSAKVSEEALQGLKTLAARFNLSVNAFLNELGSGAFEVVPLSGES